MYIKRIVSAILAAFIMMLSMQEIYAFSPAWGHYYSEYVGRDQVYSQGYFYFYLESKNKKSQVKIQLDYAGNSGDLTKHSMCIRSSSKATYWRATIVAESSDRFVGNNHRIRFSNGTNTMYVWTKADQDDLYAIYDLPLIYDMPAHEEYITSKTNRADIVARLNFKYYSYDNKLSNSAKETGYHQESTTSRAITIQANTAHVGVRSNGQNGYRYYGSTIALNVGRKNRTVSIVHRYMQGNQWVEHSKETKEVMDGDIIPIAQKSIPGQNMPSKVSVESDTKTYTIDRNHVYVCQNSRILVNYEPWKYTIQYNKNTQDQVHNMPTNQNKTYQQKCTLSPLIPQREGYTFQGWLFENKVYLPGATFTHEQNGGSIQLLARWNAIKNISAKDNYYSKNENISVNKLIQENTSVYYANKKCSNKNNSYFEGNNKTELKVVVSKIAYPHGQIHTTPDKLDTSKAMQNILVTYTLYDGIQKIKDVTSRVHIIDDIPMQLNHVDSNIYIRFIANLKLLDGKNALNTLEEKSIWVHDELYKRCLHESLNRNNPSKLDDLID